MAQHNGLGWTFNSGTLLTTMKSDFGTQSCMNKKQEKVTGFVGSNRHPSPMALYSSFEEEIFPGVQAETLINH